MREVRQCVIMGIFDILRKDLPAIASCRPTRWQHPYSSLCLTPTVFSEGSTRDGCWACPCCGQKPGSGRIRLGGPLERSSPAEIVRQVARRDALEAYHPALQPAVVGFHVPDGYCWRSHYKATNRPDAMHYG